MTVMNITYEIFANSKFSSVGRCSYFGGPHDTGVAPSEGLALARDSDIVASDSPLNGLWLPAAPPETTGLARRLNPWSMYCACRWDYSVTPVEVLRRSWVIVVNPRNSVLVLVKPVDWGPNANTGRMIDLSPGAIYLLQATTNDVVRFALWCPLFDAPFGFESKTYPATF